MSLCGADDTAVHENDHRFDGKGGISEILQSVRLDCRELNYLRIR